MPSTRNLILTLVVGLLVTLGLASAVSTNGQPCQNGESNGPGNIEPEETPSAFSRLLSSASPEALHRFLHSHFPGTYRHGVLEAIHSSDPELASSIAQLAKRQGSNETLIDSLLPTESIPETPIESSIDEATQTSDEPTEEPTTTAVPTPTNNDSSPSETPTEAPTEAPTETPTEPSTEPPTEAPTTTPTREPTTETTRETTAPPEETTTTTEVVPTSDPETTTTQPPTSEGTILAGILG